MVYSVSISGSGQNIGKTRHGYKDVRVYEIDELSSKTAMEVEGQNFCLADLHFTCTDF